jgi:sugar (pentulose or hexulose) kinase
MYFLGIDAGASFLKGAVLNVDSGCVERPVRLAFPSFLVGKEPDYREVSAEEIIEQVSLLLDQLLASAGNCEGLVLCGQMHGMVLLGEDGSPLSDFISWQDERSRAPSAPGGVSYYELLGARLGSTLRQAVGNEVRPGLPVAALFAMKAMGLLPSVPFRACSLVDFISSRLCGSRPVTDPTNAAAHGCMDVRRQVWHSETLEAAGLQASDFPEIVSPGTRVGSLPARWGGIPCYVGIGDQQAALLGASLHDEELSLNIATGSQVSILTNEPAPGNFQLRPFFEGKYLRTVTHIPAGRSLNTLIRLIMGIHDSCDLTAPDVWSRVDEAVESVHESDLLIDLSFFASATGKQGSITNIRDDNFTIGHLFRASVESMAANYLHFAKQVCPTEQWRSLLFSGGLVRKVRSLARAIERRFDCPSRYAPVAEDTLQGLLYLARHCADRRLSLLEVSESGDERADVVRSSPCSFL